MEEAKKYRHEYKYLVSAGQLEILKARAQAVMQHDSHVSKEGPFAGYYNIRSVYFDDLADTCYLENESGTDPREKFRIRIYNHSDERISLELKSKRAGMCLKQSCPLTREQTDILLKGQCLPEDKSYPAIFNKLLYQIKTRGLRPVVIVEYDRIPFVYPVGNVRVTLDMNISASNECQRFFDGELPLRPILGLGQHILEVKWDELLPDHIYHAMDLQNLQWTSFSKFYLCRRFSR